MSILDLEFPALEKFHFQEIDKVLDISKNVHFSHNEFPALEKFQLQEFGKVPRYPVLIKFQTSKNLSEFGLNLDLMKTTFCEIFFDNT